MTQDEYNAIERILYDKDRNFLVRSRLIEYMETVKIEEKSVEAPSIEDGVEDPSTGLVDPQEWQIPKELFLSGKPKPEYPVYNGPPTFDVGVSCTDENTHTEDETNTSEPKEHDNKGEDIPLEDIQGNEGSNTMGN